MLTVRRNNCFQIDEKSGHQRCHLETKSALCEAVHLSIDRETLMFINMLICMKVQGLYLFLAKVIYL